MGIHRTRLYLGRVELAFSFGIILKKKGVSNIYNVGHARCVVPAVKTKQNLVRGRVWCRLSSERVHIMNYTRTRVHHMCYITPRVYSVTSGTRVTVRHACYSTPRVYATRVHHACTPRPGYRPRHAAIWHCPYRYELYMKSTAVCSYEEYGGMPIGRVRLYTYMKSTVVCPYEEYGGMPI
jgi:hypothetical protein